MSAANPVPTSEAVSEKRPYEPSMEEILASIRRIIADDQSLPGRIAMPETEAAAPVSSVPEPQPVAPQPSVSVLHPQRAATPESEQASASVPQYPIEPTPEPLLEAGPAHGPVTAPQFAMPEGPVTDAHPLAHEPLHQPVVPAAVARLKPEPEPSVAASEPMQAAYFAAAPAESEEDDLPYDSPIEPAPLHREFPLHDEPTHAAPLFSAATDSAVSSAFNMLAASRLADNSDELMTLAREMIRPLLRTWIDDNLPGMVERMVRAEIERVARGGR